MLNKQYGSCFTANELFLKDDSSKENGRSASVKAICKANFGIGQHCFAPNSGKKYCICSIVAADALAVLCSLKPRL